MSKKPTGKAPAPIEPPQRNKQVAERVRLVKERMARIRVVGAGYHITDASRRRITVGEADNGQDSHATHLAPKR